MVRAALGMDIAAIALPTSEGHTSLPVDFGYDFHCDLRTVGLARSEKLSILLPFLDPVFDLGPIARTSLVSHGLR